jgi:hypothetical protein
MSDATGNRLPQSFSELCWFPLYLIAYRQVVALYRIGVSIVNYNRAERLYLGDIYVTK